MATRLYSRNAVLLAKIETAEPGWCLWRDEFITDYYLDTREQS